MIKDLIVVSPVEQKILISLEKLQGNGKYIWIYRFVVDNQEMMSFGYSDKLSNMGLFVEFKATGLEEFSTFCRLLLGLFKG